VSQDPSSTKGTTSNADTSKKRALGVLEQDDVVSFIPFEFITCFRNAEVHDYVSAIINLSSFSY